MASVQDTAMGTNHRPQPKHQEAPNALIRLLESADVRFNGDRPWDIQVLDPVFYDRIIRRASLGFGESYMDAAWENEHLDETFHKLLNAKLNTKSKGFVKLRFLGLFLRSLLINRQSRRRAFQVGEHHYDIGNDVYAAILDPTMSYSCGLLEGCRESGAGPARHAASHLRQAGAVTRRATTGHRLRLRWASPLCGTKLRSGGNRHYGLEGATGLRSNLLRRTAGPYRADGLPGSHRSLR